MKIIISPAKKMNIDSDTIPARGRSPFIKDTERLCQEIQKLSYAEAKALWKCNDKLAELNYGRFADMDLSKNLTPAILSYEGLQYQHMGPIVFSDKAFAYVEDHLRILSGFYGVLNPFHGVVPYRLEMQARLSVDQAKDLYAFWDDRLYKEVIDEDRLIINLASKEYSKCIEKYLKPEDRFVTIEFGELVDGKVKQKGTMAKMARGEMVRFMAENDVTDIEELKKFHAMGLKYNEERSDEKKMVFLF